MFQSCLAQGLPPLFTAQSALSAPAAAQPLRALAEWERGIPWGFHGISLGKMVVSLGKIDKSSGFTREISCYNW
jgi:hypothetical protein